MKRIISVLAVMTLSVVACGDDDDDSGGNTAGTSGSGGAPDTGEAGSPAVTAGAPATGNVDCDPELEGVCQNAMDCSFVESGEARLTAGTCGQSCLLGGNTDPECPVDCMLTEMELDMSSECAGCYGDAAICGISNCAAECVNDPEAEECQTCLIDANCRADFNSCSGLEQ